MAGRTADRAGFTDEQRIRLLEGDMDKTDDRQQRIEDALSSIRNMLLTALAGLAVSAVLLGLNLAVGL